MKILAGVAVAAALWMGAAGFAAEEPVKIIASHTLTIHTPSGTVGLPLDVSLDLTKAQPGVTRAVILLHGKGRDVDGYYRGLEEAARRSGTGEGKTILLAPQFLNEHDIAEHQLGDQVVRWRTGVWEAGTRATGPAPVSAYEALDALFAMLSDRKSFPNLTDIVLAGHSGGGQAVQRYAVVGKAPAEAAAEGIHVRFVIANPSSYLYFSDDRPGPHGFSCGGWNTWKYGIHGAPDYVRVTKTNTWDRMEADYAAADVIYLMGEEDTDPRQKDLDTSCAGEAEGPTRLARGEAYVAYLKARHTTVWNQRLWLVPGVAHHGPKMMESPCGVKALFATGTCMDETAGQGGAR